MIYRKEHIQQLNTTNTLTNTYKALKLSQFTVHTTQHNYSAMTSGSIVTTAAVAVAVAAPVQKSKVEVDIFVAWLKGNKFSVEAKKISKNLEGLAGCKNIWKESPQVKVKKVKKSKVVKKKVYKSLEGLAGCKNIWKESPQVKKTALTTCSACGIKGHNSRTCSATCQPCRDQSAHSICFSGLTAGQATSLTAILEVEEEVEVEVEEVEVEVEVEVEAELTTEQIVEQFLDEIVEQVAQESATAQLKAAFDFGLKESDQTAYNAMYANHLTMVM